ncbi:MULTISPECIES: hypothetical protein [Halomicrobium]|uniref:Uncharacterized protein n=2 Tax=Halomicrobium mukohataei TaxID=57705 RepID=C7NZ78_HALMD|nr:MULTISPECIES: hypothetical protein [Halomicrobium]ACV46764.1 hypothetical protein Hmuk_0632 [Halomicrobium mukohataei DSM 12286]QCD65273.1 hypothetical protein E5139_06315 [Halomicrobium mukohataei]QFR20079.1 hypothetical protein GBQ70_06310 [Halomicrobium sp. ZPS1]
MPATVRRDALLAALASAGLLALLVAERAVDALTAPAAIASGVAVALLVEVAFLRSTAVARLWTRPAIQLGSAGGLLAVGLAGYALAGPLVVAALSWGLVTYFALLCVLLASGRRPTTE